MKNKIKLSKIENMWLFSMFDLPVTDKQARKEYTYFRKSLLAQGFTMLQFSVYAKFCASRDSAETDKKLIQNALPSEGQVRMFMITDKQFESMSVFYGIKKSVPEDAPEQLLLF